MIERFVGLCVESTCIGYIASMVKGFLIPSMFCMWLVGRVNVKLKNEALHVFLNKIREKMFTVLLSWNLERSVLQCRLRVIETVRLMTVAPFIECHFTVGYSINYKVMTFLSLYVYLCWNILFTLPVGYVCSECSALSLSLSLSLSFAVCIMAQHHLPSFLYSESLMKCRETQPWGGEDTDASVVYCDFLQSL